ncbi:Suppressor of fused protein SUFU [Tenacibaculum sp. 190524A02b]|uniref:Suppressor of fused protein SUFU n=1 Tax=Tenacibaculum vairaonense TaxID=3137860 RepID=A0ABM9PLG5_9FLAO
MNVIQDIINSFQNRDYFEEHYEWINEHIEKYFPDSEVKVFHELMVFDVKVHVHLIKTKSYKFDVLITSGMSSLEMEIPEEAENSNNLRFAEIMMLIPKKIEFEKVYTGENKNDYIISMLKQTAKFPHQEDSWIGIGHSIVSDANFLPYGDDTAFVGGVILPSVTFDESFTKIKKKGRIINIYSFFPLYKNEVEFKINNGYSALLDKIIEADSKEILNPKRENLIKNNF